MVDHDMAQDQILEQFDDQVEPTRPSQVPQNDMLKRHREEYKAYKQQYAQNWKEHKWSLENLTKQLQENPIYGTKYNYTLEGEVMNHYSFETKI